MVGTKWSLKVKLLALCGVMNIVPILVGVFAYSGLHNVKAEYTEITESVFPAIQTADRMYLHFQRIRIALRSLGLPGITEKEGEDFLKDVQKNLADYENLDEVYRAMPMAPEEKEAYQKVSAAWVNFKGVGTKIIDTYKTRTPGDNAKLISYFLIDCPNAAAAFNTTMTELVRLQQAREEQFVAKAKATTSHTNQMMVMINLVGVIVGICLGIFFAISLSKSVDKVSVELASGAHNLKDAAKEISDSSQSLAEAASQQAASIEETGATLEELTSMVRMNSENAKQAVTLAATTRDAAEKGEKQIKTLIDSIQSISSDSKKVAEITSVIDDIAFQTNLLALNAAVEAARAGEQGRGFAVVADAVRSLAQRSAQSAKDIASLIQGTVHKIEEGSTQANHSGVVLNEVVDSVHKVTSLITEIATASEEQATGILQIGRAMSQLDQTTQKNAAASEQAAASAENLSSESLVLMRSVGSLDQIVKGRSQAA